VDAANLENGEIARKARTWRHMALAAAAARAGTRRRNIY
jgi:hypothetical protein